MAKHSTITTITLEVSRRVTEELADLAASVPLASRHAVARAALLLGMRDLARRPTQEILEILMAQREARRQEVAP